MKKRKDSIKQIPFRTMLLTGFFVFTALFVPAHQNAVACDLCGCPTAFHGSIIAPPPGYTATVNGNYATIRGTVREEHQITTDHILEEFEDQEEFLLDVTDPLNEETIFGRYLHPAWMMMTEQLVHSAMDQMLILGTLLDAKQQLEVQTVFQELTVEAFQDYQPSHNMCVMGTNVRSLAEAERNYEFTTYVLSQRSIDRQMGNMLTAGARGQYDDHCFRLKQFRLNYCNLQDNNDRMLEICNPAAGGGGAGAGSVLHTECLPDYGSDLNAEDRAILASLLIGRDTENKDIDYTRVVDRANTLEIDFYDPAQDLTNDERDIFALASNLYSHDVMFRIPETSLRQRNTQDEILDMRSVIAKRSVAEHSFNTIVGMKAWSKIEANEFTYPFMELILETMGLGDGPFGPYEMGVYLDLWPSYYAQMELLTRHIFQNPDFYTNLYDEPANVERQGVALQAIGLMQDFDTWQSYLRTEAMLSVVLELELLRLNNQVQNQMSNMRSGGFSL